MSELQRQVKGGRAAFFDDPDVDRLLAMLTRLTAEHWALRERVVLLEKILAERGALSEDELESYQPDEALSARLDAESGRLIRDVLGAARNIRS